MQWHWYISHIAGQAPCPRVAGETQGELHGFCALLFCPVIVCLTDYFFVSLSILTFAGFLGFTFLKREKKYEVGRVKR